MNRDWRHSPDECTLDFETSQEMYTGYLMGVRCLKSKRQQFHSNWRRIKDESITLVYNSFWYACIVSANTSGELLNNSKQSSELPLDVWSHYWIHSVTIGQAVGCVISALQYPLNQGNSLHTQPLSNDQCINQAIKYIDFELFNGAAIVFWYKCDAINYVINRNPWSAGKFCILKLGKVLARQTYVWLETMT